MPDVSKINVNETVYDIKDAVARAEQATLEGQLGDLAYKNTASGSFTPAGSVSAPAITITPSTEVVKGVNSVGSLPAWSASVTDETLSFSFSAGALPTTKNSTVMTGASAASAQPTFTGTAGTVTVS